MTQIADKIIDAILAQITFYNLDLLKHYPDDLLMWDRNSLSRSAHAGAKFAYVVGHTHSHLAKLGVHREFNECPTYWTRLSNDDRFYVIDISRDGENFTMKEVTREYFPNLANTAIPYRRVGLPNAFWLYRNQTRVGTCRIDYRGVQDGRQTYHAYLAPIAGMGGADKIALEDWAQFAANEMSGTLFRDLNYTWEPAIVLEDSGEKNVLEAA